MASVALFEALQDFAPLRAVGPSAAATKAAGAAGRPSAGVDVQALVSAEVARAEAALLERLSSEHRDALEAERRVHQAESRALAARLGHEAGERIAAGLAELESRIGELAAASAARILGSFLTDELKARAIASLAGSIQAAVRERDIVRIRVRGPQSLFEALAAALGERAAECEFVEAAGFDLTVAIDGSLFETRLSEWAAALAEILA